MLGPKDEHEEDQKVNDENEVVSPVANSSRARVAAVAGAGRVLAEVAGGQDGGQHDEVEAVATTIGTD